MNDSMAAQLMENILQTALNRRASDIHIEPQAQETRIRYRVDGLLQSGGTLTAGSHSAVVSRLKLLSGMDIAERRVPLDGRLSWEQNGRKLDLRLATLPTIHGEKITLRILEAERALLPLAELGFSEENLALYRQLISAPNGLVLLTGPTGSGKSTTLYATLQELSSGRENIVTLEDPVEYELPGISQVAVNRLAGLSFASGMRALVRQDPDIIMVGEIRDKETADMALAAALTGHLVFSTLHTNSAAGAVTRLLEMGAEPFLLAAALRGVVAQRLVRSLCRGCCRPEEASVRERLFLGLAEKRQLQQAQGCRLCGGTGYYGRLALQEVLPVGQEMRELIARYSGGSLEQALAVAVERQGWHSLYEDGRAKVLAGRTAAAELLRVLELPPGM